MLLCGSFSKTLAPGYRTGYIAAGSRHDRVLRLKKASTLAGATLPTLAIAEFLKNGGYDRYLRTLRLKYRQQVARMREAIVETFPDVSQFWTYDPKQFLAAPGYSRDFPPAKYLE